MTASLGLRPTPALAAAAAAVLVMGLGGLMTDTGPWSQALRVPAWKPPDWAFGPAWTVIFVLWAIAAARAWQAARSGRARAAVVGLFALNGLLNILWTGLFFALRRPDWAMIEVGALWLSILALIVGLFRLSGSAGLLLVPYLLWVTFAAGLTVDIVRLNAPF